MLTTSKVVLILLANPLETPQQTHPKVCFTNSLGVSQPNQINNQVDISALLPHLFYLNLFGENVYVSVYIETLLSQINRR